MRRDADFLSTKNPDDNNWVLLGNLKPCCKVITWAAGFIKENFRMGAAETDVYTATCNA
jgi:hypothetical protein